MWGQGLIEGQAGERKFHAASRFGLVARAVCFWAWPMVNVYNTGAEDGASGQRLDGSKRYRVTFAAGEPPVRGFWSLTLYDAQHFFVPNDIGRYSVGTKNRDLLANPDGSVTIHVQATEPTHPAARTNWLPAPHGAPFSLHIRSYWPERAIVDGVWTPPAVMVVL